MIWWNTRILRPLDLPVSMSPGHIRSPEFHTNLYAVYLIEIAADTNRFPDGALHCLLGYKFLDSDCAETHSVVLASWAVSSNGQLVARGSSDDDKAGGGAVTNDTVAAAIGSFDGEEGCNYILDVEIHGDGSKLAPGNPRLRVEVFPYPAGKMAWGPPIIFISIILELAGIALLVVAGVKRRRMRGTGITG
jgi:hypothetical protein